MSLASSSPLAQSPSAPGNAWSGGEGVLVLTDRRQVPASRSLVDVIAACVAAGARTVVLRELDLPETERAGLAARLIAVGATVIAAHTPLPGCVGVHLPARAPVVGGFFGRSCHSAAEVRAAAAEGAAYVTLSPYAASESKPGYRPIDPAEFKVQIGIPVYALGGITPANAADALAAGADGLAVMGSAMRAEDPGAVVTTLRTLINSKKSGPPPRESAVDHGGGAR